MNIPIITVVGPEVVGCLGLVGSSVGSHGTDSVPLKMMPPEALTVTTNPDDLSCSTSSLVRVKLPNPTMPCINMQNYIEISH